MDLKSVRRVEPRHGMINFVFFSVENLSDIIAWLGDRFMMVTTVKCTVSLSDDGKKNISVNLPVSDKTPIGLLARKVDDPSSNEYVLIALGDYIVDEPVIGLIAMNPQQFQERYKYDPPAEPVPY